MTERRDGRPSPRRFEIAPMRDADLDEVLGIEEASFPVPWSRESFRFELHDNPYAWNVVVRTEGRIVGFACLWVVGDELKINNIAIHPEWRGKGLGDRLLRWILRFGRTERCVEATLEVRPSNAVARKLYRNHGFEEAGLRKDYYRDTHEDAIVMVAKIGAGSEEA